MPEKVVQTKSGRDVKSKNRKAEEVSHARGSKGGKNEAQVSLDKRKAREEEEEKEDETYTPKRTKKEVNNEI